MLSVLVTGLPENTPIVATEASLGDQLTLTLANGVAQKFPARLPLNSKYQIDLAKLAGLDCTADPQTPLTGTVTTDLTVNVACTLRTVHLDAEITGLFPGKSLKFGVAEFGNAGDLSASANGKFQFSKDLVYGNPYHVIMVDAGDHAECQLSGESGVAGETEISVQVNCQSFPLNVAVEGLTGGNSVTVREASMGAPFDLNLSNTSATPFGVGLIPGTIPKLSVVTQPVGQYCAVVSSLVAASGPQLATVRCSGWSLSLTVPPHVSTYTCAPLSVSALSLGASWNAFTEIPVALGGLASGSAYASLADCRAGSHPTTTLAIAAGTTGVSFFYRTSTTEALTLTASSPGFTTASSSITTVLFRVLGKPSADSSPQIEKGLSGPADVYSDGTRLFVVDNANNRVLVWNTMPTTTGTTPSFVLGQPNLTATIANNGGVSGSSMSAPQGVFSDGTRLFVADQMNSRVLVWNTMPTANGQGASFALGQPNLTSNAANNGTVLTPSSTSLFYPTAVSGDGTRLFVADSGNNRVLGWSTTPVANGQAANFALGQADLNSRGDSYGVAWRLHSPNGVFTDGVRLFVADTGVDCVVVWNTLPTTSGQAGSFVLGKPDPTCVGGANAGGLSASSMYSPSRVFSDGTRLFVSDASNSRVLIWDALPTTDGQAANRVLGQPDFTSNAFNNGGVSGSSMFYPRGIFSDGAHLFVADTNSARVLAWNPLPVSNGQAANFALGQPSLTTNVSNNGELELVPAITTSPRSIASDGVRLFVADTLNNRVLVWTSMPSHDGQAPDVALGQPDLSSNTANNGGVSAASMSVPAAVYSDRNRLYVADSGNNRVLVWNSVPSVHGQPASFALGQPDLTSNGANNGGLSAATLKSPNDVTGDGTRIFVADSTNHRVLVWNAAPTASGQAANFALGQPNLTSNTVNNGGLSASSMNSPRGVFTDGTHLFVSDRTNHRVLGWDAMPTTNGQAANFALGQPDLISNTVNNGGLSASTLNFPVRVSGDKTRLFVSDTSNHRVLVWDTVPRSNGQAANFVLGQPNATSNATNSGSLSATSLNLPYGVYSDNTRVFVSDSSNNRVLILPLPGI